MFFVACLCVTALASDKQMMHNNDIEDCVLVIHSNNLHMAGMAILFLFVSKQKRKLSNYFMHSFAHVVIINNTQLSWLLKVFGIMCRDLETSSAKFFINSQWHGLLTK